MKNQLIFIAIITFSLCVKAQIYTPGGTIQGTSSNNNVGIGTSDAIAKLTIQAGPNGYPTPLKAISIWGPNSPENSNSAQDLSWDFAGAGSASIRSYRGGSYDTYLQFLTNAHNGGNAPQVRMHINPDGNVGIGTMSPNARLDLGSGYGSSGAKFLVYNDNPASELSGTKCGFYMDNFRLNNLNLVFPEEINNPGLFTISAKNTLGTTLNPYFSIAGMTGFVGIGTINPSSKLEVIGTIKNYEQTPLGSSINSSQLINSRGGNVGDNSFFNRLWLYRDSTLNNWYAARLHDGISIDLSFNTPQVDTRTWWERDPYDNIQSWGNAAETYLTINKGNIGIGTTIPDAKLAVNGTIHSKEVRVDINVPAPDYVFANDYKLKSLQQVEDYIKENSHLPEIPSAKEIEKNGLMLAEMNMSLLKKIEELTLYAIEQQKNTAKLIQLLDEQNKRIEILEKEKD